MRKLIISIGLAIVLILLNSAPFSAQGRYPEPVGYVNDFANVIPENTEQQIERMISNYEIKTTHEIAVVTVKSLDGLTVEDYTMGLAEQWKVGKKGKDNGVIILLALNEREIRIEVGYGLEPILTDSRAALIIDKMVPLFKDGNYAAGLELSVKEVMGAIGFLTPEEIEQQRKKQEEGNRAATAVFLMVLLGTAVAAAVVIFFVMLCKKISVWQKERQRKASVRQEALQTIGEIEKELQRISSDIKKLSGGDA